MIGVPSMSQWMTYIQGRPEARLMKCVRCLVPISWMDRQPARPIRGTTSHQRYERSRQDLSIIVIGALIQKWEEVTVIDSLTGDVISSDLIKRIVPMMTRGVGCPSCQWMMAQATAATMPSRSDVPQARTIWVRDPRVYDDRGIALPTSMAQHHRPALREVRIITMSAVLTPFLDVSDDVGMCPKRVRVDDAPAIAR